MDLVFITGQPSHSYSVYPQCIRVQYTEEPTSLWNASISRLASSSLISAPLSKKLWASFLFQPTGPLIGQQASNGLQLPAWILSGVGAHRSLAHRIWYSTPTRAWTDNWHRSAANWLIMWLLRYLLFIVYRRFLTSTTQGPWMINHFESRI